MGVTIYFALGGSKHSLYCYTFVILSHNFMEQSHSREENGRSSGTRNLHLEIRCGVRNVSAPTSGSFERDNGPTVPLTGR
jgi:hypothetical protein